MEIVQLCPSPVLPHEISAQNCAGFEAKQKSQSSWTHSNPGTWKRFLFLPPTFTATSLHPPRLCRNAVFSIKPTFSSVSPDKNRQPPTPDQETAANFQQSRRTNAHILRLPFELQSPANIVINIIIKHLWPRFLLFTVRSKHNTTFINITTFGKPTSVSLFPPGAIRGRERERERVIQRRGKPTLFVFTP